MFAGVALSRMSRVEERLIGQDDRLILVRASVMFMGMRVRSTTTKAMQALGGCDDVDHGVLARSDGSFQRRASKGVASLIFENISPFHAELAMELGLTSAVAQVFAVRHHAWEREKALAMSSRNGTSSFLYDVIIVGAGPAGLTAATYLGRFRRRVLILDGGPSRASWIPESHNTPGFPHGVGGDALLSRMSKQASLYGAERRAARADSLTRTDDGFELAIKDSAAEATPVRARFVLLATGIIDRLPDLENMDAAIRAARVRICPICDAYEAIDQRIAVIGDGDLGAREAAFLTTYSPKVTLLHLGSLSSLTDKAALGARGVEILPIDLADLSVGSASVALARSDDASRSFDCLYLALGCEMQSRLAVMWGAAHDAENNLVVDGHQQTSIDGLYAAGDVVRGLNQIAVATAEAAIAATDIHKRIRSLDASA